MDKLKYCKKYTCRNCNSLLPEITIMCNVEKFTLYNTYLKINQAIFTHGGYFIISKSRIESMMYNHLNMIGEEDLYESQKM